MAPDDFGVSYASVGALVPNTTRLKPEWDFYVDVPNPLLWGLVAMTCDIDPRNIDVLHPTERNAPDLVQFWKRFVVAQTNVEAGRLPVVQIGEKLVGDYNFATVVSRDAFLTWLASLQCRWELPLAFPGRWRMESWASWGRKDTAEVWQAAALACNLDPDGATLETARVHFGREFNELLDVAMNCRGDSLEIMRPFSWPTPSDNREAMRQMSEGLPSQERATVRLVKFRRWAEGKGYTLPNRFPAAKPADNPPAPEQVDPPKEGETTSPPKGSETVQVVEIDGKRMVRTPAGGYITEEQFRAMTTEIGELPPFVRVEPPEDSYPMKPSGDVLPASTKPSDPAESSMVPGGAVTVALPHTTTALQAVFKVMRKEWTGYDTSNPPRQKDVAAALDREVGWKVPKGKTVSREADIVASLICPDHLKRTKRTPKRSGKP